ncbi:hypothetical protein Dimus_005304 [Dionaea muscipula]
MSDKEGEGRDGGDVGPSTSKRSHRERTLFTPGRLNIPSRKIVRRCMDSLMRDATHTTIRSMRRLPLKHKCTILCRNMAETALLMRDVLFSAVRLENRRCRKIDRLKEEKYALEREIKEWRFENDSTFEISSQMKADVDMVMGENQTLERKNEELENKHEEMKSALEREKSRGQTLEEKMREL